MKYQLVLQLDASVIKDFDQMIDMEDKLIQVLGDIHEVDGHDFGSGEINIFIHTNEPNKAFNIIQKEMNPNIKTSMKVAYRELTKENYTVLWPDNFSGEFKVI